MNPLLVAKVGGSLFDLPDLGDRLRAWLGGRPVLLVPGGGAPADAIRRLDQTHNLGDATAHWLALRVLSVNAQFLSELLGIPAVPSPTPVRLGVLDAHAFCQADEGREGALDHSWRVTSDSIAARAAVLARAELVLLKSTDLPEGMTWADASRAGLVDEAFAEIIARSGVRTSWVNLRGNGVGLRR
jgi:aspartokinase-like uncharacterized kinase